MLNFAVAGSPNSTRPPGGTIMGIERAHELGITAMEIEWVHGVPSSAEHVENIGKKADALGVILTIHAPYYINLNAREKTRLEASKKRVIAALTMGQICGAVSVCVHGAFYLGMEPDDVYENVRKATGDILSFKPKYFPNVNLAYETMGKKTQFGTLREVLKISKEFGIYPCVDAAHMHARTNGGYNSKEKFNEIFDLYAEYLGTESLRRMHLHYSGIDYGPKGERMHLQIGESDADWEGFVSVIKKRMIGGVLVCESPALEDDTLLMAGQYALLGS